MAGPFDDDETVDGLASADTIESHGRDDDLGSMASLLHGLAAAPGAPPGIRGPLTPGQLVAGKYRVVRAIGEGGMGVVYLARDLRLDRDAALKLGTAVSAAALVRVEREALALARLSHPNVVTVYEVGEVAGRVFVAMEYVAGGTARTWLDPSRSWREIIALYAAAGDGLAAAHAAGIVHRDFKPDNVLVGADGRPRVADFGLARGDEPADHRDDADVAAHAPLDTMTRTGAVVGTPAYMPPEQLAGATVDARADLFAFCAALWESLFAVRPFVGATPDEVKASIESSAPRTTGDGGRARKVPRHIETALRRGLRADPAERWPAMAPLLAELRRDPGRRRRNLALAAAVVAAIAAALVVPRLLAERVDPCAGGAAQIADAWSPARAAQVRAALDDPRRPWTHPIAAATTASLDAWARRWTVQYRAVCEAGGGAWSPALRDRGLQCLARRRRALIATADVLVHPDPHVAARADAVVTALDDPERCADPASLTAPVPPPPPGRAAAIEPLSQALARVHALRLVGDLPRARVLAEGLVPAARALDYRPLVAGALEERGSAYFEADDYAIAIADLRDAYFLARADGDTARAGAMAASITRLLLDLSRDDLAGDWSRLSEVEAETSGDPRLRADALAAGAVVASARGDHERALALSDQQLALVRGVTAPPTVLARALVEHGVIAGDASHISDQLRDLDEASRIVIAAHGDRHPLLVKIGAERALALKTLGRLDEAIATARRAVALADELFGPDDVSATGAVGALGIALMQAHQYPEALTTFQRSLALDRAAARGQPSFNVAQDLDDLAMTLQHLNRLDEAVADWHEGAANLEAVLGPTHEQVASLYGNMADALFQAGRTREATDAIEQALRRWPPRGGDDVRLGYLLTTRGALRADTDLPGSRDDLERALAIRSRPDTAPEARAYTEFLLAQVVAEQGDLTRAVALATAARDDYRRTAARLAIEDAEHLLATYQARLRGRSRAP